MIEISGHMDKDRKAIVSLDEETRKYIVTCTDGFGARYTSDFLTLHAAENFAEDWVLQK
jgi:hypothetical protein